MPIFQPDGFCDQVESRSFSPTAYRWLTCGERGVGDRPVRAACRTAGGGEKVQSTLW
jgi:hypothetical protein